MHVNVANNFYAFSDEYTQLYAHAGSFHFATSWFGRSTMAPILGRILCSTQETAAVIADCQIYNQTSGCHHGRNIGVVCAGSTSYPTYMISFQL